MDNNLKSKKALPVPAIVSAVIATLAVVAWIGVSASSNAETADVVVYKTASCGCCVKWVAHLRESGLDVSVVNVQNTQPAQERLGVPRQMGSCHTAAVGDYWVEGHVPADLVQQLIREKPADIRGIAVPGMPMGAPGMEGPNPVKYQVVAYGTDGKATVYATRQGQNTP